MSDELRVVEEWAAAALSRLSAGERRKLARAIGNYLAKSNRARIKSNLNPDGTAYEKRRPRPALRDRKGAIRREGKAGPMFRKLSRPAELGVLLVTPDQVDVGFKRNRTAALALVHQLGLVDQVERAPGAPRLRYPKRVLLGLTDQDGERVVDMILDQVAG